MGERSQARSRQIVERTLRVESTGSGSGRGTQERSGLPREARNRRKTHGRIEEPVIGKSDSLESGNRFFRL